jgi:hypothetical protein
MSSLRLPVLLAVLIGMNGCAHYLEVRRVVYVDLDAGWIAIVRDQRVLAVITPEGPFPEKTDVAWLRLRHPIGRTGTVRLSIPEDVDVDFGALVSGTVDLNFDKQAAQISVEPSKRYHWLEMTGTFPLELRKFRGRFNYGNSEAVIR